MAVTRRDIALAAKVDPSVVSAVLNGSKSIRVSESKRELILSLIKEMKYSPNQAARALRYSRSYNIGVALPTPRDPFYAEMTARIQETMLGSGYNCLFSFWRDLDGIQDAVDDVLKNRLEGIITNEPNYLPDDLDIAVVTYFTEHPKYDYVGGSQLEIVRLALDYLHELGHRKIGYVGRLSSSRGKAFQQLAEEYDFDEYFFVYYHISDITGRELEEAFRSGRVPDAFVCANDETALAVMQMSYKYGIRIPDDLSIIGGDDSWLARLANPQLTSMKKSEEPLGKILVETLLQRIRTPNAPRVRRSLTPQLIIRNSCAPKKQKESAV